MRTLQEKLLLKKLTSGAFDGKVGSVQGKRSGARLHITIADGIPSICMARSSDPGAESTIRQWLTDDEKLTFLKKYGWKINHRLAISYSAK